MVHRNKALPFSEKRRQRALNKSIKRAGNNTTPTQEQLVSLLKLFQQGQLSEAKSAALYMSQRFPKHGFAWKILGSLYTQEGDHENARKVKRKAVAMAPQDPETHNNLAVTLEKLGQKDAAKKSYLKALQLKTDYVQAHYNLAALLKNMGHIDDAKDSYTKAIELKPDYVGAHYNLAVILKEQGQLGAARKHFARVIEINPKHTAAHRLLTGLKTLNESDPQIALMQTLYDDPKTTDEERSHLSFGLAKTYEDIGKYDRAFSHYKIGNSLKKSILNYDISKDVEQFENIKRAYPEIRQLDLKGEYSKADVTPVFIIGMPRSGTSLVEHIISAHSRVIGAGELPYVAQMGASLAAGTANVSRSSIKKFREQYLHAIEPLSEGKPVITDKMPQNFRYIGLLATAFPEAKFVNVKRQPQATCWGNYKQFFISKSLGYAFDLHDIVRYYALYEDLMDFWKQHLSQKIYDLDYDKLTVRQEDCTRQLIDHLDLLWEDACLEPENNKRSVVTASKAQVREKVYQGSSQKWKIYEPFLDGVFDHFRIKLG